MKLDMYHVLFSHGGPMMLGLGFDHRQRSALPMDFYLLYFRLLYAWSWSCTVYCVPMEGRSVQRFRGARIDDPIRYVPAVQKLQVSACTDLRVQILKETRLLHGYLTLVLMGGRGVDSIHLFKELFSQPKLDIFMGV